MKAASSSIVFRPLLVSGQHSKPGAARLCWRVLATSGRDSDDRSFGSRIVDENMIVLRMRIQEVKMVESNYEVPSHWMEWEKKYYSSYNSDVGEGVGQLQKFLMSTRPSVALGLLVLLGLSVPTSVLVIVFKIIEVGEWISQVAIHH